MEEKRKIHEWEKIYNVDILSYDGFNQACPDLFTRFMTQKEFEEGLADSTAVYYNLKELTKNGF